MSELVEMAPAGRCCLRPLIPRPGAEDLFEVRRWGRAGGRGSGDECGDLMFFFSVLDFLYRLPMCSLPNVVSCPVSSGRPVWRLVLSILPSLVACLLFLFVSWGVSFLISFYRLVSYCLLVCVLLICVSP